MLVTPPNNVCIEIEEAYRKLGPLTISMFEQVAIAYQLARPKFDIDLTEFRRKAADRTINEHKQGQFLLDFPRKKNGIVRSVSNLLMSESFFDSGRQVGLSRQISCHGVAIIIMGPNYKELARVEIGRSGQLVLKKGFRSHRQLLRKVLDVNIE